MTDLETGFCFQRFADLRLLRVNMRMILPATLPEL
jgi:hypothetical protein